MRYLKYLLIFSLISILFSKDETIAKVYFKDGSDKIGYIDENYSESQIKLVSLDGGWALYSKKSISCFLQLLFNVIARLKFGLSKPFTKTFT